MTYLRYRDDIETIQADEQGSVNGNKGMPQETEMPMWLRVYCTPSDFHGRESGVVAPNRTSVGRIPA
ncbi:hypothetical protein [uncultured Sphingomonas sp.]|uniref:hypothetical protein n=1 Tax=uncultured Sphingomonas sp. TaxID=158754 RepID=UPI0035CC6CE3